jgi:hypothetical protein
MTVEMLSTTAGESAETGDAADAAAAAGIVGTAGFAEAPDGTRHLIHRPASWDHCLLDAPGGGEQRFVVAGPLPEDDGPGHFHDPRHVARELREVGAFVGHRFFDVPAERPGRFSRLVLDLTDVPAWRAAPVARPRLTTYLTTRPQPGAGRVPRGLDLDVAVRIDEVRCCTGGAELVFPLPAPQRGRIEYGRRVLRAAAGPRDTAAEGAGRPVDPAEVGRRSPGGVLLTEPAVSAQGRLATWVLPPAAAQAGDADGLLLEALRQASVLAAGRSRGFDAGLALVAGWDVRFRGEAQQGPPLRCAALPGALDKDPDGRPCLPVTLTVTQSHRPVALARTRVVQDL